MQRYNIIFEYTNLNFRFLFFLLRLLAKLIYLL